MASSITLAGESLKAQKQGAHEVLEIRNFVLALVPGLDPNSPIDRSAGLPPAEQIVGTWPYTQKGFVDPNRVVYSLMLGSDVGDFDWNWIGLTTAEGVLFAVSTVPVQQKRRNIPPLQTGNNVTRNFMLAFDGAQALTAITVEAGTWQHDFTTALAGKLGLYDTAVAAGKLAWQDLRSQSDLYGPPSSLHGKGTITGFTSGALLGIPGLSETDYGVAELSGQWTDTSGLAGAAQRVFRTSNGRQFYQHQLPAQDVWSDWYELQNVGQPARSQNRVEILSISADDSPPGLTIYTNIPAVDGGAIGTLRITGALNSYTSPVEMLVGWYFYEGAVHMPEALVSAAGGMPTISIGVHNGKIAVQIAFAGGSAYIPRLVVELVNIGSGSGSYQIHPDQLKGWTYSWALDSLSGLVACNQKNVINDKTIHQYAPGLDGYGATGTWGINISGFATWATEAGYAASAGHTQVAGSATWAGESDRTKKLTLHGGDHCTFIWADPGGQPTYVLGMDAPNEGRPYTVANFNVNTARRAGTLNWTSHSGQGVGDGNHLIFDASGGLSPSGAAIGSVDPVEGWTAGYPTLMGWNGQYTYGVRVDRARVAETALVANSLSSRVFTGTGNDYDNSALILDGAPAAGVFPTLTFKQPGKYAGMLRMKSGSLFSLLNQSGGLAELEVSLLHGNATSANVAGSLAQPIIINGTPVNAGSNVTIGAVPIETRYWQDVSAARVLGVNYTNDAPVTITLAVSFADNGSWGVSVIVNGEVFGTSDIGANSYPFFIDVPPGHVYQVNGNGNWLEYWKEFRP